MKKKPYTQPVIEIIKANYEEGLMKWVSTPISDDEIEDVEFNAKQGSFDSEEDLPSYNLWEG